MQKKVYCDAAASTYVGAEALAAMLPVFSTIYGNPSSQHLFGAEANELVAIAREQVAKAIKAKSSEIIFTSGGTESNNLAILGLARARRNKGNHVIVSQIEHPSVLEAAKVLEKEGFQVTYLPVTETGLVSLPDLMHEIKKETILISIMMANNEVGTVQNIRAISDIIRDESIILHTDAVQAFGAVSIDVKALEVDALTISGHKIYGPKGVGALYLKTGVAIAKQQVGGGQERGLRSGTLNVPGIVGFGKACEAAIRDLSANNQKLKQIRDYFIAHVKAKIPGAYLNGHPLQRLANNANFSFEAIEGEGLLTLLSINGIAVSTGSACNSEKLEKSHVLKAMNIPEDLVQSSIRFSFAKSITKEDIDYVVSTLASCVEKLRSFSPFRLRTTTKK